MIIQLTDFELKQSEEQAKIRIQTVAIKNCKDPSNKPPTDVIKSHHTGTFGERIVARGFGFEYTVHYDLDLRNFGDVGNFEVKCTDIKNGGLGIQSNSDLDRKYVLVIRLNRLVGEIKGWIYGHEIETMGKKMNPKFKGGNEWYLVPQNRLRPIHTFFSPYL